MGGYVYQSPGQHKQEGLTENEQMRNQSVFELKVCRSITKRLISGPLHKYTGAIQLPEETLNSIK